MAVQTQIQVRRGTASSWTSTNPTLAAGEVGFETDTGKFKIGTGSATWTSLTYFSPGATASPLTTKGDIWGYSTTNVRLPVGSDGQTLVADSSQTTGLGWANNFAAGKNKIINGDFGIWQRGTSFTTSTSVFSADRFLLDTDISTTCSQQTFTAGTAPVSGYEGTYFLRVAKGAGGTYANLQQRIEDVRTFAGQTVTLSFWAKVSSGTFALQPDLVQNFGSGGSASTDTYGSSQTVTTSWARYSYTVTLPSISGKTIGTNSYLNIYFGRLNTTSAVTVDFWGVQLEAGSVATAFQTATGTIQGELAACQRYCYSVNYTGGTKNAYNEFGVGRSTSATSGLLQISLPVTMRVAPSAVSWGGTIVFDDTFSPNITALGVNQGGSNNMLLNVTCAGGLTAKQFAFAYANNDATAYIRFETEL